MTAKKLDAALILRRLAEIRKSIPFLEESQSRRSGDGRLDCASAEEFEYAAVAEGLETLAADLGSAIDRKHAEATEAALQIYYTAEELARDPEHAHVIPHVEKMREAYLSEYGRPIPPRPKR
ncbi:MAG: hypothetical protein ACXW5U_08075 [Thermoanaerobaculia bacterium]